MRRAVHLAFPSRTPRVGRVNDPCVVHGCFCTDSDPKPVHLLDRRAVFPLTMGRWEDGNKALLNIRLPRYYLASSQCPSPPRIQSKLSNRAEQSRTPPPPPPPLMRKMIRLEETTLHWDLWETNDGAGGACPTSTTSPVSPKSSDYSASPYGFESSSASFGGRRDSAEQIGCMSSPATPGAGERVGRLCEFLSFGMQKTFCPPPPQGVRVCRPPISL